MDEPLNQLTDAQRSRLWAEFKEFNHQLVQTKQIDWNKCIRSAYLACTHERLAHESALLIVVRWGLQLRWLADPQAGARGKGYFKGFGPAGPPAPAPAPQPISEAKWRAVVAELVADLRDRKEPRAAKQVAQYPKRAKWLRARLAERGWDEHDLQAHSGPDHKTTQKILKGLAVRGDVLDRLAQGFSRKGAKVELIDIPEE